MLWQDQYNLLHMQTHLLHYLVLGIRDLDDGRVHIVTNTVHHSGREAHVMNTSVTRTHDPTSVTLTQWTIVGSTASGGCCEWVGSATGNYRVYLLSASPPASTVRALSLLAMSR